MKTYICIYSTISWKYKQETVESSCFCGGDLERHVNVTMYLFLFCLYSLPSSSVTLLFKQNHLMRENFSLKEMSVQRTFNSTCGGEEGKSNSKYPYYKTDKDT